MEPSYTPGGNVNVLVGKLQVLQRVKLTVTIRLINSRYTPHKTSAPMFIAALMDKSSRVKMLLPSTAGWINKQTVD